MKYIIVRVFFSLFVFAFFNIIDCMSCHVDYDDWMQVKFVHSFNCIPLRYILTYICAFASVVVVFRFYVYLRVRWYASYLQHFYLDVIISLTIYNHSQKAFDYNNKIYFYLRPPFEHIAYP